MSHQIIKFNEAGAIAAGLPKDLVNTIRHLVASVGRQVGQMTLPEVASGLDGTGLSPLPADPLPFIDPLSPIYCPPLPADDLTPALQPLSAIEYLQTEVRQMAEQIAFLSQQINDLNQGKP